MKKKISMLAVSVVVLLMMSAFTTAHAQTTNHFTANIPFDFHVGSDRLPAGEYTVRCLNPSSDVKVLQLRKTDGKASVVLHTNGIVGRMNQNSRLVFSRYGNQYYFARAWLGSERIGMQAIKSRQEKATAKEMARLAYQPEMVALTIRR